MTGERRSGTAPVAAGAAAPELVTLGRVSLDLFSEQSGEPFERVRSFDARVGGSPVNIAIGASRLGVRSAVLTAVGEDRVGDLVLARLRAEGVDTRFVPRIPGTRTPLAVLGIEPPDRFPLVFYRERPADVELRLEHVEPLAGTAYRSQLLSGSAFSRGSCRDAAFFALEEAEKSGAETFLDLDLRADQWSAPRAYGLTMRALLERVRIVIGTEEEFHAALASDPEPVIAGRPLDPAGRARIATLLAERVASGSPRVAVLKRGARGVRLLTPAGPLDSEPFPVEVVNTVGAGDAFAAGLVRGWLRWADWPRALRWANACGALLVTRRGCSDAMPFEHEVRAFLAARGIEEGEENP